MRGCVSESGVPTPPQTPRPRAASGAAQLRAPPGGPAARPRSCQAPRNPVPCPDPTLQVHPPAAAPTPPTPRSPAPCPGASAAPPQASRPAACAAPRLGLRQPRPWGICDSPYCLRPGAQADSSADKPAGRAGQFNTFPEQLFPDRFHMKVFP